MIITDNETVNAAEDLIRRHKETSLTDFLC